MHRFYLPTEECQGSAIVLTAREAHHALHVVRLRRGERVSVLDGIGHEHLCEVRDASRKSVTLFVLHKNTVSPLPYRITLLQALTKGKAFETTVQKATELGTFRVVPLLSERAVSQPDDNAARNKTEKWKLIAVDAIKQCGSAWLPHIERPLPLKEFLAGQESFELMLVASLQSDRCHARTILEQYRIEHGRLPRSVAVFIGPEGDFTPAEMDAIKKNGGLPVTLGPLTLRSDTAAVYVLSVLNYELQAPPPASRGAATCGTAGGLEA